MGVLIVESDSSNSEPLGLIKDKAKCFEREQYDDERHKNLGRAAGVNDSLKDIQAIKAEVEIAECDGGANNWEADLVIE